MGFTAVLTSGEWWVSVIIAGIVINLISVALSRVFERAFSKYSKRRRDVAATRESRFSKAVEQVQNDPQLQVTILLRDIIWKLMGVFCAVIFLVTGVVPDSDDLPTWYLALSYGLAAFAVVLTYWFFFRSMHLTKLWVASVKRVTYDDFEIQATTSTPPTED